jgi:rSAM/selenodomain-associated transferase 2
VRLSVIVPTLDEGPGVAATLEALRGQLDDGDELLVVDGGSTDDTCARARHADRVLAAQPGRARQMNAGAAAAGNDWLWFVHADTLPRPGAVSRLRQRLAAGRHRWGRFDIQLSGSAWSLRVIATAMNLRSRWSGIATGDQGLFVDRDLFVRLGGYPDQPLMEDVALSAKLRQIEPPLCLPRGLVTSSRRWETHGVARTVWLMWRLRWAYWRGADPVELARRYRGEAA